MLESLEMNLHGKVDDPATPPLSFAARGMSNCLPKSRQDACLRLYNPPGI